MKTRTLDADRPRPLSLLSRRFTKRPPPKPHPSPTSLSSLQFLPLCASSLSPSATRGPVTAQATVPARADTARVTMLASLATALAPSPRRAASLTGLVVLAPSRTSVFSSGSLLASPSPWSLSCILPLACSSASAKRSYQESLVLACRGPSKIGIGNAEWIMGTVGLLELCKPTKGVFTTQ